MIPEQRMHAKGVGVYGTFAVADEIGRYMRAEPISAIGKQTLIADVCALPDGQRRTWFGRRRWTTARVGSPGCRTTSFTSSGQLCEARADLWCGHRGDTGAAGGGVESSGAGWCGSVRRVAGEKVAVYGSAIHYAAGFSTDTSVPMVSTLYDIPDIPRVGVCSTLSGRMNRRNGNK
ncbi:catalase [Burkholderia sp. LMG 21824]|uniref:catalase n=1 Tax=Burkholderia sp. LMG 21824 TaxID=3158172 RepID=UPI003C2CFDD6